ncbi:hypothetical protein G6F23_015359 [Rhizopus arrhizus]|nr:hypothetical protein G6F23_015359 [Rhizopus arrhizus]
MPMRAPRSLRSTAGSAFVTSTPSNRMAPPATTSGAGVSPMMARAAWVLPLPDSPTMPTISPGATSKDTPLTISRPPVPTVRVRFDTDTSALIARPSCGDRDGLAPHRPAG